MIKHIHLEDFRGFENYDIDFKSGVNLLIGDNGSGKTSLLRSVILALNSFFTGFSDENTTCTGISVDDFRYTISGEEKSMTQPVTIKFDVDDFKDLKVVRKTKKGGTTYPGAATKEYMDYLRTLQMLVASEIKNKTRRTSLPLFANFQTDDIHGSIQKVEAEKFKEYYVSPSFGYYLTLKGGFFSKYWIKRLIVLGEGGKGEEEVNIVKQAIVDCLGPHGCNIISEVEIRPKKGYVYFHFTDGREVRFEDLSDGYKRLVNIVMDLAFRCSCLNRTVLHEECCKQTNGTVCIDELDDHLHPALQSTIIKSLQHTFRQLQFIITTHAPLIMTSVEDTDDNQVVQLSFENGGYSHHIVNTYGMDASTIIKEYLHVADRDKSVYDELENLSQLIDEEQIGKAKDFLALLRDKYEDRIPELSKAEALLSFYDN